MAQKRNLTVACTLVLCSVLLPGSASSMSCNILDFGAVADGIVLNTAAIQAAIDACSEAGGGEVAVPAGRFRTGTIFLKSNITLRLHAGAVLLGSTDLGDYPETVPEYRSYTDNYTDKSLIYGEKLENVSLVGKGIVDGQGERFSKERLPYKNRPFLVRMIECKNVTLRDVTLRNSPMWVQHYLACEDVVIDGIVVDSRRANLNNDGIDIDSCSRVRISNCFINAEDDALVLKATSDRPCEHVTVTNCVLSSHCNAFKCGTESNGGFRDILVSNCTIFDTRYSGIALELVDGGEFNRVAISNITMTNVNNPIFIHLGNRGRPFKAESSHASSDNVKVGMDLEKPGVGSMQNISITNVLATGVGRFNEKDPLSIHRESYDPRIGCSITGMEGHPVKNVSLENIRIEFPGGGAAGDSERPVPGAEADYPNYQMLGVTPAYGFYCRHVENIRFAQIDLSFAGPDARPAFVFDDVADLSLLNCCAQISSGAPAWIDLINVRSAWIDGNRPAGPAKAFARIKDELSRGIVVTSNDLRAVAAPVVSESELSGEVILVRDNVEQR